METSVSINKTFLTRMVKVGISLICILIGGLIYLGYRPTSLLMFNWIDTLHLNNLLSIIRTTASSIFLSKGIIYNVPSFLWLFSYMFLIDAIWEREKTIEFKVYLYSVPLMAIISEFFQLYDIIDGTFDIIDIVGYLSAITLYEILELIDK